MSEKDRQEERKGGVGLKERAAQRVKPPPMYQVIILNDDFTPIEFVTALVETVFRKTPEEAAIITLEVHHKGAGIAGTYTYEIAETKVAIALSSAKEHGHPLQLIFDPED